jgi:putative transcription factor
MSQQDVARELNERSSIIAKLESGKISPTIRIARKLERLFKLTLLEEAESLDLPYQPPKSTTTLGDVVQIRKKKDS